MIKGIENDLLEIEKKYRFRSKQIHQLSHFMQLKSILPNLMVCGPPATGKTTIIRLLADRLKIFYIWFDCNTYDHNERLFYAKILLQMGKKIDSLHEELNLISNDDENNLSYDLKHVNQIKFLEMFSKCLKSLRRLKSPIEREIDRKLFLILDDSDVLIEEALDQSLIYLLNNLNELTENIFPISVIWITKYSLDRFCRLVDFRKSTISVDFPPYNQQQLKTLLVSEKTIKTIDDDQQNLWENFITIILRSCPSDNNLNNLRFICHRYFANFIEPIERMKKCDSDYTYNAGQLFVKFQPYINQISSQMNGEAIVGFGENIIKQIASMSISKAYIYISIFLATYNSTKSDVRFFVRNQRTKSKYEKSRKSLHSNHIDSTDRCPHWFDLERAYHIYRALIDFNESDREIRENLLLCDTEFFHELADLFEARILLGKFNYWIATGDAKYKLSQAITDEIIDKIALKIDLDLRAFINHPLNISQSTID